MLPLADGGDGTLETLVAATDGEVHLAEVHGPLGDRIVVPWGRLGGDRRDTAVIEMARASGLGLLTPERYNPLKASTFGTGELMLAAISAGCTRLLIGIGGSATNDGGAGMACALGARLLDSERHEIAPGGAALASLATIDMSGWKLPASAVVQVACDVNNPLTGPHGASFVYGPQKGATQQMVRQLDVALARYAAVLEHTFGKKVSAVPGSGAAGGLGAGLVAFCNASLQPGAEMVLDAVGFDTLLSACDVVVTGEGRLDSQTAHGKLVAVVARRALKLGKPCIALVGSMSVDAMQILGPEGLTSAFSIATAPMTLEDAMRHTDALIADAAEQVARTIMGVSALPNI
jgi:glycerate kinase